MPRVVTHNIREQFPSANRSGDDDLLILFIEEYYRYLQETGNPGDLQAIMRDINNVDTIVGEFFEQLRLEYLPCIPSSLKTDRATLIKQIRDLYRAKGTEKSIETLFRILFDQEIEIVTDLAVTSQVNIRVYGTRPTFESDILNRTIQGSIAYIVLDNGTGTYTVGETVEQINSQGTATAEVLEYSDNILILTNIGIGFEKLGNNIIGQSSGASYQPASVTSNSFTGFVSEVTPLEVGNPDVFDLYLTSVEYDVIENNQNDVTIDFLNQTIVADNRFDNIYINEYVKTIDNELDVIDMRTLGVINDYDVVDRGTNYIEGTVVPFDDPADGSGGIITISDVYENIVALPGTWEFNGSNNTLIYNSVNGELERTLFPGNTLEVDGTKYTILEVDYSSGAVIIDGVLSQTEDLTKVFKSFNDDDRRILDLEITDAGYGYTTTPTLDFTGIGDGTATGTLIISGSYNQAEVIDKGTEFGYIIRTGIPINQFLTILKKTVHPAGFKVTSELVSFNVTPQDYSLRIGELYAPERENYNHPDYASGRFFFDFVVEMYQQYHNNLQEYYQDTPIDDLPNDPIDDFDDRELVVEVKQNTLEVV
jgi:hypothetical protein